MAFTATELELDYFQVYDVADRPADAEVSLRGQFDQKPLPMHLRLLDYFANPASKDGEAMFDRKAHLAWYRGVVEPPDKPRVVEAENQFGKFRLQIGQALALLVPTEKIERGSGFAPNLDHYKVYVVLEGDATPAVAVKLADQFGKAEARVGRARFFAVPVAKKHKDAIFRVHNEAAHLVIHEITPRECERKVSLSNQIGRATTQTLRSVMLAVPSRKRWRPPKA